jgi:hypothetical protein
MADFGSVRPLAYFISATTQRTSVTFYSYRESLKHLSNEYSISLYLPSATTTKSNQAIFLKKSHHAVSPTRHKIGYSWAL